MINEVTERRELTVYSVDAPVIVSCFRRAVVPRFWSDLKKMHISAEWHGVSRCRHVLAILSPRCSPAVKRKYNAWMRAISRSDADGKWQKQTLITGFTLTGWCKDRVKTTYYKLKIVFVTDTILWEFPVNSTAFISCNLSSCICACGRRGRVASKIFRADQNSWYLIT